MSVAILIIGHHEIGNALLEAVSTTFSGELPLSMESFPVSSDADPDTLCPKLETLIEQLDQGDGVLLLTDLYGSTPCNIATKIQDKHHFNIVTGLNLAMLIRVMNYPEQNLDELTETAKKGGQEAITSSTNLDDNK